MNEFNEKRLLKPWKIDVAVLCIFFVRDSCFAKSFAAVKEARPRVLLLWQDGPRADRPDDLIGIDKCRKIAEDIDWDCEVHTFYNKSNYGCDPSTFYSHKWAFSIVDKCIVLEDDVVPDQSFFPFCKELLDKYEDDRRINRICGMNNVPGFKCSDSYFFSGIGSVWGWATWKRVADLWDEDYTFLNDTCAMSLLGKIKNNKAEKAYVKTCYEHKREGVPHWETVQTFARYLNSQLSIIPSVNMIKNVGLGENSTHSNTSLANVPKKIRAVFYSEAEAISFPLKHPKYIIENKQYEIDYLKWTGESNEFTRFIRKMNGFILRCFHGDFSSIRKRLFK